MADGGRSLVYLEKPDIIVRLSDDKAELVQERLHPGAALRERLVRERARQRTFRAAAVVLFISTAALAAGGVLAAPRVLGWPQGVTMQMAGVPQASAALVPPAMVIPAPAGTVADRPPAPPAPVVPAVQPGVAAPRLDPVAPGVPALAPAVAAPPVVVATEPPSSGVPAVEPQVQEAGIGDVGKNPPAPPTPGLLLMARPGDTLHRLYHLVYTGVQPPPFEDVEQANPAPVHTGSVLVFPTPPGGWHRP